MTCFAAVSNEWTLELVDGNDFNERFDPTALVAGGVVMGIIGGVFELPEDERPRVQAWIPRKWRDSVVCGRITSNDGHYEAENAWVIPADWPGHHANFAFPTDYVDQTKSIGPADMGVSVSHGACTTEPKQYTHAFWNSDTGQSTGALTLLLNSYRASEVYLLVGDGADATVVECEKIQTTDDRTQSHSHADENASPVRRVAFDYQCLLGANLLSPPNTAIEINRIRRRQADKPITITIVNRE